MSAGTKKQDRPLAPGASPVRAKTVYMSAMPPFDIHVFSPFKTQFLPSFAAVVARLATSEPLAGSESAKPAIAVPAVVRCNHCFCRSSPNRVTGPMPRPCIANAKSARASWRANVSRIRQSDRTSSAGLSRLAECRNHPSVPSRDTSSRQAASTSSWLVGRLAAHQASSSAATTRW